MTKKFGITYIVTASLLLLFMAAFADADENQWSTNGPVGGSIKAIAIHPFDFESIFIGTIQNGFYRSTNAGSDWAHIDSDILPTCTRKIAFHPLEPDTIYVATTGGMFKSSDGGDNWEMLYPPYWSEEIRALLIHPTEPSRIIAGGAMCAWMSLDGGRNWSGVDTYPNIGIASLAVDPNNPDIIYLVASSMIFGFGVWKSEDRGVTWNNIQNNIDTTGFGTCIEVDPVDSEILYISYINVFDMIDEDCLVKSYDGGQSWIDITPTGLNSPIILAVKVSPSDHNTVFICTGEDGVFKSTDGGEHWQRINTGLNSLKPASIEFDYTNGIIYLGTYYDGIYKSTDDGENWLKISSNIFSLECFDISVSYHDSDLSMVAALNSVYRSPDCGQTWDYVDIGYSLVHLANTVEFDEYFSNNIYAATGPATYPAQGTAGFYRSSNNGESWEFFNNGLPNDEFYVDLAISSYDEEARRFFLASSQGLYSSDDLGENWTLCTNGLPTNMWFTVVEVAPTDPNIIAVGDAINRVFISYDRGETWHQTEELPEHPRSEYIKDIEFHPFDVDHIFVGSYFLGLFESTDGGESWNNINNDLPLASEPYHLVVSGITINPLYPQNMFVASNHCGVYQSHNGGQNWESFNTGLDTTDGVGEMMFAPGDTTKLYFATSMRSVWTITRTPTAIDDDITLPMAFTVSNYPNPFNASTNIKFTLPNSSDVRIDIYDILGRRVSTIVNEHLFAGYHSVIWNPVDLSSGIYFYKIEAGEYETSKKMMLLR